MGGDDSFNVDVAPPEDTEQEETDKPESPLAKTAEETAKETGIESEEVQVNFDEVVAHNVQMDQQIERERAEQEELAMWDLSLLEGQDTAPGTGDTQELPGEELLEADAKKKTPVRATVTDAEIEAQLEVSFTIG